MKVPVYERSVLPPAGNFKAIEAAGMVGEAISGLGKSIKDIGVAQFSEEMRQQHEDRRARLAVESQTSATKALYEVEEQTKQDKEAHMKWGDNYNERSVEKLKEIEDGIDDDRVKEAFSNWSLETIAKGKIRLQHEGTEMSKMLTQESTANSISTFTDLAIKNRKMSKEYIGSINSALNLAVASGAISPEERGKSFDTALTTILDGHVDNDILSNPWEALKGLRGNTYEGMHERRRTEWIRRAKTEIDQRERDNREQESIQEKIDIVQMAYDQGFPLDHEKYQNHVDLWYDRHMKVDLQNIGDVESRMKVANFVGRLAVVPTPVQSYIRANMNGTPAQAVAAADMIDRIHDENPAMKKVWTDDELAYAGIINAQTRAGTPPVKAVELAKATVFEMPQEMKDHYKEAYREGKFVDGNLSFLENQKFVSDAGIPPRMKTDNAMLVSAYFSKTGGNISLARQLAANDQMRKWSREEINGEYRMVYLGPSRVFNKKGQDPGWIPDQFDEYRNSLISKLDPSATELMRRSLGRDMVAEDIEYLADEKFERNPMIGYALTLPTGEPVYTDTGKVVRWVPDFTKTEQFNELVKLSEDTEANKEWEYRYKAALNGEIDKYMEDNREKIKNEEKNFLISPTKRQATAGERYGEMRARAIKKAGPKPEDKR